MVGAACGPYGSWSGYRRSEQPLRGEIAVLCRDGSFLRVAAVGGGEVALCFSEERPRGSVALFAAVSQGRSRGLGHDRALIFAGT